MTDESSYSQKLQQEKPLLPTHAKFLLRFQYRHRSCPLPTAGVQLERRDARTYSQVSHARAASPNGTRTQCIKANWFLYVYRAILGYSPTELCHRASLQHRLISLTLLVFFSTRGHS